MLKPVLLSEFYAVKGSVPISAAAQPRDRSDYNPAVEASVSRLSTIIWSDHLSDLFPGHHALGRWCAAGDQSQHLLHETCELQPCMLQTAAAAAAAQLQWRLLVHEVRPT